MNASPTSGDEHEDLSASYAQSWQHLEEVARLRSRFAEAWRRFLDGEPYNIRLSTDPDGKGTINVWVSWPEEAATELSGLFIELISQVQ